jgi:hypothetical protein
MEQPVAKFIADNFYWVFLGVLAMNVFSRKHQRTARKKRMAILFLAIIIFGLYCAGILIVQFELSDYLLLIYVAIAAPIMYIFREKILPFRFKCRECRASMDFNDIAFHDSNLCAKCRERAQEGEESA